MAFRRAKATPRRGVLHVIAFAKPHLVAELSGRPALGRVSGGGARSVLWLTILASVLELPLRRLAVEEGAPFGAALLGGVAAGVFADIHEAIATCVHPGEIVAPVAEWVEPYREARERFVALYPALATRRPSASG